jgi:phosphate:Na+ symporter
MGGLGLFLLGMVILTEGLRALAGDAVRSAIMRFTHTPLSGAITGATTTAILQSSSATTVAAVGFVGAGLIGFPEALGIIFGANIGTTLTGWLVTLLGFKLKLGLLVLPLVFIGAVMRLFGSQRVGEIGFALAGFGLIFVGISFMQDAMQVMQGLFTFDGFSGDSILDRLLLLLIGVGFTVVTQSSSAGVAATLTAVFAGMLQFNQAAALVIGMDIGTTVTAALATIGGTTGARRTGYSHVIYNILTGIGALLLITPYTLAWEGLAAGSLKANPGVALVGFHTFFNILGVIVVLPFTRAFARFMERLVPEKIPVYLQQLDGKLREQPTLALTAVQATITAELLAILNHIQAILGSENDKRVNLAELDDALDHTQEYLTGIHPAADENINQQRLIFLIHTLDHMQRLHERCEEDEDRAINLQKIPMLDDSQALLQETINQLVILINAEEWHQAKQLAQHAYKKVMGNDEFLRNVVVKQMADKKLSVTEGTHTLQAIRWLARVSKHLTRITKHLNDSIAASGAEAQK